MMLKKLSIKAPAIMVSVSLFLLLCSTNYVYFGSLVSFRFEFYVSAAFSIILTILIFCLRGRLALRKDAIPFIFLIMLFAFTQVGITDDFGKAAFFALIAIFALFLSGLRLNDIGFVFSVYKFFTKLQLTYGLILILVVNFVIREPWIYFDSDTGERTLQFAKTGVFFDHFEVIFERYYLRTSLFYQQSSVLSALVLLPFLTSALLQKVSLYDLILFISFSLLSIGGSINLSLALGIGFFFIPKNTFKFAFLFFWSVSGSLALFLDELILFLQFLLGWADSLRGVEVVSNRLYSGVLRLQTLVDAEEFGGGGYLGGLLHDAYFRAGIIGLSFALIVFLQFGLSFYRLHKLYLIDRIKSKQWMASCFLMATVFQAFLFNGYAFSTGFGLLFLLILFSCLSTIVKAYGD